MQSRIFCCLFLSCLLLMNLTNAALGFDWNEYKNTFLSKDGRIIDFYRGDMSHSEGQGYGLLLALANGDAKTFELIWKWSKDNLQKRKGDALFCWSWGKRSNGQWGIMDYNNATDGDILIAWALAMASEKWNNKAYRKEALKIIKSIKKNLIQDVKGKKVILPGYYGFDKKDSLLLNPSYMINRAFPEFAKLDDPSFWKSVYETQKELLKHCQFGQWRLPSNWILLDKSSLKIKPARKAMFSYDAYRIFLYDVWASTYVFKESFKYLANFFERNDFIPEEVRLSHFVSIKDAGAGMYAMLGRFAKAIGNNELAKRLFSKADKKIKFEKKNYYSLTLYLLAKANLGAT